MKPPFVTYYALQNYLSAENGIIDASQNNFDYWYIDASHESERPDKWDSRRIDNLNSLVETCKVSPLLHGNFKIPIASDVNEIQIASIKYIKKEIDLAEKIQAPLIIHGGGIVEPRLVKNVKRKSLEIFINSLEVILNYAELKNVTIFVENLSNYKNYVPFHYIFTNEIEISYVLEKLPEIKIFFDIGHANIGCDPLNFFSQFHFAIHGISISNNNGIKDQHLSFQKGTIDYTKFIAKMIDIKWKGIVSFEIRDKKPNEYLNELLTLYEYSKL